MKRSTWTFGLLAIAWGVTLHAQPTSSRGARPELLAALDRSIGAAEATLRAGELHRAESHYRDAIQDAWMILGGVHAAAGKLAEARDAFRNASRSAVDADAALQSLAIVHLQLGEAADAATLLTKLAGRRPRDRDTQRLLAQALMANGQREEAVQVLDSARAGAPDDPEITFMLASAYLQVKKLDAAERLFAEVRKARPTAETDVLIGRTYRDSGLFQQARTALQRALKANPRVRRAHYYLGTLAVMDEGVLRLDEAIREFRAELQLAPRDTAANLRMGMALVESRRHDEALPHLVIATSAASAPPDAFHYLGRCQLALGRSADAVVSLKRALAPGGRPPLDDARVGNVHYQLALALRDSGEQAEAMKHFDEAKRASARRNNADQESLKRFQADAPDAASSSRFGAVPIDSPVAALPPDQLARLEEQARTAIARASLNLGIIHAQAQRFSRAADFFEQAAAVDPDFPQVQYSLGVAYFNAQQYEKAAPPLARVLAGDPGNADVRRMLAMAWFNSAAYDKAAALLAADPGRESNPSLQYTYGLALVRSHRAEEAEAIFSRLLTQHGDQAELQVVLGQAHAQQGDYESAISSLRRALEIKPTVGEARTSLGIIYLQQGRLAEAAAELKAELAIRPDDVTAQHTLAAALELDNQPEEALVLLRRVLKVKPDFADARYLLGKVLLAQGAAAEAVDQLQAAIRLEPENANAHYQLAQAYQKLGRTKLADEQLAIFRRLKDKSRGRTP